MSRGLGVALAALGGALGVGLLAASPSSTTKAKTPVPIPAWPDPPVKPPPSPAAPPPPPPEITFPPNGRRLTAFEKATLRPFFTGQYDPTILDDAVTYWGVPASSFNFADDLGKGLMTVALTTVRGVYFRWPNHELHDPYELATMAHELVHADQFRKNDPGTPSQKELPAYILGMSVLHALTADAPDV